MQIRSKSALPDLILQFPGKCDCKKAGSHEKHNADGGNKYAYL